MSMFVFSFVATPELIHMAKSGMWISYRTSKQFGMYSMLLLLHSITNK